MEPSDGALMCIPRGIALHKVSDQALFAKFACAIGTGKEAPNVLVKLRLDDPCALELRRGEPHYFVQKKSPSIWRVSSRYSTLLRRLNERNWNTSSVMSIRLNCSRSCSAPRRASHWHLKVGR